MSKEFDFESVFRKELVNEEILEIIKEKDQRIAELEEQLKTTQAELDFSVTINKNKKRLYNIWVKINKRCFNNNCEEYKNYGGRGITICKEWQKIVEQEVVCFGKSKEYLMKLKLVMENCHKC